MTAVPPEAIAAISRTVVEYEPQATAAVIASPKQLLSVLLEAANRAVYAAAPLIADAERKRFAFAARYTCACQDCKDYLANPDAEEQTP